MMISKTIEYPFTEAKVTSLHVGDQVRVSGRVFTGRDRLHRHLADGGDCPVDLRDGTMFHCGPVVVRSRGQWLVRSAGPTTSIREEPYMASIIANHGVRVVIGKGGMGQSTLKACVGHGCVYLQAVGGAAAWIGSHITQVNAVYFMDEFGPTEAMWDIVVEDLPAFVAIDTRGCNMHQQVEKASRRKLDEIIRGM